MSVVIDASALLQLWLAPDATRLVTRLQGASIHAPAHVRIEATNVIRRQRHAGILKDPAATTAFDGIVRAPLRLWPFEVLAERVWELGANASSYDATYLALAERLALPLITHDGKLSRVPGVRCRVEVF